MFNALKEKDASKKLQLHIIVPCFNPAVGWEKELAERFAQFREMIPEAELLLTVVNDGSEKGITDAQVQFLKDAYKNFHWISYPQNKGKGFALRQGVAAAEGDFFIYTDIDFPYTLNSMMEIYNTLKTGADVAVGVRESNYYLEVPLRREIISKVLKKLIKYLLRIPIIDTQCGLKGFNKNGKEVFLKTMINRFLFDMEFVQMSFNSPGLKVKPVTVFPRPDIVFSKMNYKVLVKEIFNFISLANPLRTTR